MSQEGDNDSDFMILHFYHLLGLSALVEEIGSQGTKEPEMRAIQVRLLGTWQHGEEWDMDL